MTPSLRLQSQLYIKLTPARVSRIDEIIDDPFFFSDRLNSNHPLPQQIFLELGGVI